MVFLKKLAVLIYALLLVCAGALFVLLPLNVISADQWTGVANAIGENLHLQVAVGCVGAIIILIGVTAPFRAAKGLQGTRIIAFQNPDGEVTISITAIEDYIKKIAGTLADIKDIKSRVSSSRRGINIVCDISILPGANIPEVTEQMQSAIKNKLSGMLGVEEKINIQMNISKIAKGAMEPETGGIEEPVPHVPFREMR
ncbi:MAG: alkaline shock response membrane anchor protein AmaP [Candidatus Omnitrophota bacterium]|jgi:uncharacterized alkaline shock family protein YloU